MGVHNSTLSEPPEVVQMQKTSMLRNSDLDYFPN